MNNGDTIDKVRIKLDGLESTIISALLDRARFKHNRRTYIPGAFEFKDGRHTSLFEEVAKDRERGCARMGRYLAWDEKPFFPPVADPIVVREYDPSPIIPAKINFCRRIMFEYFAFLPKFCAEGDDKNYGSAADRDVTALQAIAQRVHHGMRVMEVKYEKQKETFDELLRQGDIDGIMRQLTDTSREEGVLKSVFVKATGLGLERPGEIENFYKQSIIPMTKDVQIDYIVGRAKALHDQMHPMRQGYLSSILAFFGRFFSHQGLQ